MSTSILSERRISRRGFLRMAGIVGLSIPAISLLAACGGDDDSDDPVTTPAPAGGAATTATSGTAAEPTTTTAAAELTATSASATPTATTGQTGSKAGGTLQVALTGDLPNLDIQQTADSIVVLVGAHIYETLFTWDADYRAVPHLAATHAISDDGLVNTVTLREGVLFHNGAPLTAADVIASIQRWGTLSGLGEDLLSVMQDMFAVDANTIEFTLTEQFGTFAMSLSRQLQGCGIYPKAVLDASTETDLAEYIGTGPYKLVEWVPDRHVLLERYDDYAQPEGDPDGYAGQKGQYLDQIEFVPVSEEAARVAGLQAGDYQYLETVSPDLYITLDGATGVSVEKLPPDSWLNIVLNMRSPVFADLKVRRAVQVGLNQAEIMLAAFGDGFYQLTPELVPGAPTWYTEAGSEYFDVNDPEQAKSLLAEAGYDGAPLRILVTDEVQQEYNGTLTMAQQLEAIGFTIDLQVMDGATLSDTRKDETLWEMYTAWASFRPDPVMRNISCSATGWWCNEEKDALLEDLARESDYDVRFALWEQIQAMFYADVPRLKIGNTMRVLATAENLRDIGPTEMQPDFSNAWLER